VADASNPQLPSSPEELDEHVRQFEAWFIERQRAHNLEAAGLMNIEHAIIRSYIVWLRGGTDADRQAQ
jgi:hypothetical protein